MKQGENRNGFPLVRRPSSAVEKAAPGARRILSGMVADTLALVKKEPSAKRKFRVLTCSGEEAIVATWTVIIRGHLGEAYDVNVTDRNTGSEILEFVRQQPIDFIVAMVNNILVPSTDGNDRIRKAVELLARLKAEYGIPVIAFSTFEPKSFDLPELLKQGGIDAFLWAPFEIGDALKALDGCLKTLGVLIRSDTETPPVVADTELENWFQTGANYYSGRSVPRDYSEAVRWYRKAAEQGYAQAQHNLGCCYENGFGVQQDYTEAVKWFRKAAEQNNARGQCKLGVYYANGQGVGKDKVEAVKWFRKAAEQNHADAQCSLGDCYFIGEGVTQDEAEAVKWWRKAAEQNDAQAQSCLGICYENGHGVPQDFGEAVKWYRKAADQVDQIVAQSNLGFCYEHGRGVPQDFPEAYKLYKLAAQQKLGIAVANLKQIVTRMTAVEIAEGERRYREFLSQEI
jgi:TPR repeat protein